MIRNVVLVRLRPDVDPARLDEALQAIVDLAPAGCVALHVGRDLGLRKGASEGGGAASGGLSGNWDGAITADFADEASYRAYDLDDEHNRIRRELFAPISAEIARIQFSVPHLV